METGRFHYRIAAAAMIASGSEELTAELEAAVSDGSPVRRARILRQIAALFLAEAHRLTPSQLSVFDEVLTCLLQRVDAHSLAELSAAFAYNTTATTETM